MRDIKIKTNMDKPKALTKNFTPKDAASLQKKKLEQQKTSKESESQDRARYTTDKTEYGMRNGALTAAAASRRMFKRCRSDRREKAASGQRKTEQAASPNRASGNTTTVQNAPGTKAGNSTAVQKLSGLALQAGKAIGKAVTSAASSIIAAFGGAVVMVPLLTVILVAAIVASSFGILFSGESQGSGTVPVSVAVAQINDDFYAEPEALQTAEDYDAFTVNVQAADWVEVLAVFAVKVADSDTDATDVATIDIDRIERLKAVFWDMTTLSMRRKLFTIQAWRTRNARRSETCISPSPQRKRRK